MATLHLLSLQKTYIVDIRRIALTNICLVEKERYKVMYMYIPRILPYMGLCDRLIFDRSLFTSFMHLTVEKHQAFK